MTEKTMVEKTKEQLQKFKEMLEQDVKSAKKFHDRKAEWLASSYLEEFANLLKAISD